MLVLCLSLTLLSGCARRYSLPDEAPGEYGSMTGELVEILEWANFVIRNLKTANCIDSNSLTAVI